MNTKDTKIQTLNEYKKKKRFLLLACVLLLFLSWSFGIRKTISAVQQCNELEEKAETAKDLPSKKEALKQDMILLESRIGNDRDSIGFQQNLLKTLTGFCESNVLQIKEYPGPELKEESGYLVETHRFIISGGFHNLLKLINTLERNNDYGKIAGLDFRKTKDLRTHSEELCLHLYINHTIRK